MERRAVGAGQTNEKGVTKARKPSQKSSATIAKNPATRKLTAGKRVAEKRVKVLDKRSQPKTKQLL